MANEFVVKDSGKRQEFDTGMVRDTQTDKPRFDLLIMEGVPFEEQLLTRLAVHLMRGATKYSARNHEKSQTQDELDRFKASALRHIIQWACGDADEDHASSTIFNLLGYETCKYKMNKNKNNEEIPF